MSDFLDQVRADCAEAETDLGGQTFSWAPAGETVKAYPCAPTTQRRGAMLVIGGQEIDISLTLRVRYSGRTAAGRTWDFGDLTAIPKKGDRLIFGGKNYRIVDVVNAHGAFLEINCQDANR